jgi:hypothetical protein
LSLSLGSSRLPDRHDRMRWNFPHGSTAHVLLYIMFPCIHHRTLRPCTLAALLCLALLRAGCEAVKNISHALSVVFHLAWIINSNSNNNGSISLVTNNSAT